jgi:hypothetical protein
VRLLVHLNHSAGGKLPEIIFQGALIEIAQMDNRLLLKARFVCAAQNFFGLFCAAIVAHGELVSFL